MSLSSNVKIHQDELKFLDKDSGLGIYTFCIQYPKS